MVRKWYAVDDNAEMVYLFRSKPTRDSYLDWHGSSVRAAGKVEALRKISIGYGCFLIDRFFNEHEPKKGVDIE